MREVKDIEASSEPRYHAGDAGQASLPDLSRLQAYQQEMRGSEAHWKHVFATAYEGIWFIDSEARTTYVNQRMAEMLGYTPEELVGRSALEFTRLEDRSTLELRFSERQRGISAQYETRYPRKDGSELWALVCTSPIFDPRGVFQGVLGMHTDVTERRRAEERLQLMGAVVQSFGEPIACLELDGTIVMWNAAAERFFGYAAHEVEGRMCSGLVPQERWDEWGGLMARVQAGETVHGHETVRVRKDGTRVDIALTLSPVRNADGVVTRVVAAAADITQRKREQEALRQVQKMELVCRLAGGIAHDFNNMIAVILGQVSLVTQEVQPPRVDKSIRSIKAASEQAQQLVRQLLALSQKQILDVVEVDVDALVSSIVETARHIVGETIRVALELGPVNGVVLADPAALRQVMINLILNARDAMPNGGTLSISTRRETLSEATARTFAMRPGSAARLRVRDTGCGLSTEARAHLFEPFFTTKPTGQGTGLGLATSEGIVLQSKGYIDASSEEGVGSTFDVWLPLSSGGTAANG